jgi:cytochrome P450
MRSTSQPHYALDFTDPEINRDPWGYLEEVRDLGPAVFNPPSNSWFVTSYDHVRSIYANEPDFAPASELYAEVFGDPSILGSDTPRHDDLRRIWNPYLLRKAITTWTDLMGEVTDQQLAPILDRLRDGEVVDIVPYLRIIPTYLIASMIGVPTEDCGLFTEWGERMVYMFDVHSAPNAERAAELRASGVAATKALHDYCGDQLEMRRRTGNADDLLGVLATTDVPMTEHEKRSYITMFIEGAQDTTTKFLTTALVALAQHPDQRRALVEDRGLMLQTLDEIIRWQGPVVMHPRVARRSGARVGDVPIPEGDNLSLVLGAANRDSARWSNPHDFDIFRPVKANLAFGFGIHSCMGVNLARLETTIFLSRVLDAIPKYRLATDTLDFGRSIIIRGPVSVPLTV